MLLFIKRDGDGEQLRLRIGIIITTKLVVVRLSRIVRPGVNLGDMCSVVVDNID